jgi:glycosyltransferase involved in cell wall biosynthesis
MRILVSAYACEPDQGSERGAGWEWARAAALRHEVWLMTRENNRHEIEVALAREPELRIHLVCFDLPTWIRRWKKGQRGVRAYYTLWQFSARRRAVALHRGIDFDVAHHVTFAVDWLPAGVVGIRGLPSVWGPVGGAAPFPWRFGRWLGARNLMLELVRAAFGGVGRTLFGEWTSRQAAVMVAANSDVARRFRRADPVVEPNVAVEGVASLVRVPSGGSDDRIALFVGRLVAWKGLLLTIDAMADPLLAGWRLVVVGSGPDLDPARRRANRIGVSQRIEFRGFLSRDEVLASYEGASVLVLPSMHDSGSWVIGEAVAHGVPVVCLDIGGPATIAERTGAGVVVASEHASARTVAEAISRATLLSSESFRLDAISRARIPQLLDQWYSTAVRRVGL